MRYSTFYKNSAGSDSVYCPGHFTSITLNITINVGASLPSAKSRYLFSPAMQFQIFDFTRPSSRAALFECLWYAVRPRWRPFGKKNEACASSIDADQEASMLRRVRLTRQLLSSARKQRLLIAVFPRHTGVCSRPIWVPKVRNSVSRSRPSRTLFSS